MYLSCCATYPLGSIFVRYGSHVPVAVDADPIMASEQSGLLGVLRTCPNTLAYRSVPVKGLPSGFVAGTFALPRASTTAIVGVAPVVTVVAAALPLFQEVLPGPPSKYRKMPLRAHGVSTSGVVVWRVATIIWSHRA